MDIAKKNKGNKKLGKKNLENRKQFESCMKEASKSGLQSFEYDGETYDITRFGNCVQTLVGGRFLYRIVLKDKSSVQKPASNIINF